MLHVKKVSEIRQTHIPIGKSYFLVGVGRLLDFKGDGGRFIDKSLGKIVEIPLDADEYLIEKNEETFATLKYSNLSPCCGTVEVFIDDVSIDYIRVSRHMGVENVKHSLASAAKSRTPFHVLVQE